jgi:hypothetical protein
MRMMKQPLTAALMLAGGVGFGVAAIAQQPLPFQVQNPQNPVPGITTQQGRAQNNQMLTTKPAVAAPGVGLPWQQPAPVQVTPPGSQAMPAAIPFGRPSSDPVGVPQGLPGSVRAVPVENVDMIETSEPAPATPVAHVADPVNEDPAEPTELTSPLFKAEGNTVPRPTLMRVLNKVTARARSYTLKPGETVDSGKITIKASYCQLSADNSLPDAAALVEIRENLPPEEKPKLLFSGWMYQSSSSISALEHPIYDVTLVGCKTQKPKPVEAAEEKPKKSKKK